MPENLSRMSFLFHRLSAIVLALCLLAMAGGAHAQSAAEPPAATDAAEVVPTIGTITVQGNVATDTTRILRTFEVPTGIKYSAEMVRRGTKKLMALGLFSDATINKNVHDGVIDLTIVVKERPRLGKLSFSGNKKREDVDLEKKLFLKSGETFSKTLVQTQVDSLRDYYRTEGWPRTKIAVRSDTLADKNIVDLTFQVEEGEKLRITRVVVKGASAFPEKRILKAMKTHPKGFFGGGDLKDENFPEDREKLETFYHDHGYRDMKVDSFALMPGATPRELTLEVGLHEGRAYQFGFVYWSGNRVIEDASLKRLFTPKPNAVYDHSRIEKASSAAYSEYAERGFLYVNVDPRESLRDSIVDLTFAISENSPSHVRNITILGNKGTREKVIRRELDIHEGDLFRRSALVRSQGDIMRLGIFEEANPDFTPAESTDVDLVFKVKEKQVGTASAGAGYTGTTGLTGFLEVGHSNVLGNGQSLALHLERGGRVENYSVSFTEPWFHDSPTLLGFSIYNTFSQLTEFDQRRRGGSARIGRPLPWPDYSRGSLSYTLESIRIDNVRSTISLNGITIGRPELTSSLQLDFSRNSTDNAFYPTKGTRLTASEDFTGGPLGGDLSYHKHRYEGRAYFRGLHKGITTMTRLRFGLLGNYPWKPGTLPDYTRFRLGGGNTLDPLRGYQDYQIVPDKFITNVLTQTIRTITTKKSDNVTDSTYTVTDSTYSKQRYPGGRYFVLATIEQQFPIVAPLRGLFFLDAGNTWDLRREIQPFKLKYGASFGLRMEIPLLGNIGFDYGYGFNRDDKPSWQGHFLLGNVNF